MPAKLGTACRQPGCPRIITAPFCRMHTRYRQVEYDRRRASPAARGYDAAWRRLRKVALELSPYCACGARATQVDHRVPLRAGGSPGLANLQTYCKPCHSSKTARLDGRWG